MEETGYISFDVDSRGFITIYVASAIRDKLRLEGSYLYFVLISGE